MKTGLIITIAQATKFMNVNPAAVNHFLIVWTAGHRTKLS